MKEVGFELGVKEWRSYGCWEWWIYGKGWTGIRRKIRVQGGETGTRLSELLNIHDRNLLRGYGTHGTHNILNFSKRFVSRFIYNADSLAEGDGLIKVVSQMRPTSCAWKLNSFHSQQTLVIAARHVEMIELQWLSETSLGRGQGHLQADACRCQLGSADPVPVTTPPPSR